MNKVVIEEFQHLSLSDSVASQGRWPCLNVSCDNAVGADHQMLLQSQTSISPRMRSPPPPELTTDYDDEDEDEDLERAVAFIAHLRPRKRPFSRMNRFCGTDSNHTAQEYRKEQVNKYITRTSGEALCDGEMISKRVINPTTRRLQKRRRRRTAMYKNLNGSTSSAASVRSMSSGEPMQSQDTQTTGYDNDEPELEQRRVRFAV